MSRNKNKYRDKANRDKASRLRQQQRHNDLKAFLDYEQRLRDAHARLQDPHPSGRMREDSMR